MGCGSAMVAANDQNAPGSWWTGSQRNTSLPKSRRIFGLQNNNHCETNAYGIMLLACCVHKGGALNWH
jgi:hypothetical protein